jgi:hypothetical protein
VKALISALLILLSLEVSAQLSVQGHVMDGETNTALPGANVFIANTTKGASTDLKGAFKITDLQPIRYRLVISFIGYTTQVVEIVPGKQATYKVILKPSPVTLGELVIRGRKISRSEWLANFEIFKDQFIGLSENARLCVITNPRVLQFNHSNGILTATADSLLVIENRGLGYRVRVVLDKFTYNSIRYRTHYETQMVYELLVPADEEEKIQWAQNRLKAYYGSQMHFLRTLHERRLNDEGYYFNLLDPLSKAGIADAAMQPRTPLYNNKRIKVYTITNYYRILDSLRSTPTQPVLTFRGELEVKYIMESEPHSYLTSRHLFSAVGLKNPQVSRVMLHSPAMVQHDGQIYPQNAIETIGYWSWELMGENLPFDYDPDIDVQLLEEN